MRKECEGVLAERWAEFERLYREGSIYSAIVRLGEIYNYLQHTTSSRDVTQHWGDILRGVQLSKEDLTKAERNAKDNLERLKRMISVGTNFAYEELLLAVTMRVELQLFAEFLASRGLAVSVDATCLDEDLLDLAASTNTSSIFGSAQSAAKRNWGIDLDSPWLGNT